MKRIFIIFIAIIMLSSCAKPPESSKAVKESNSRSDYVRGVWLAYYELQKFTENKSESDFKKLIEKALKELNTMGFNTLVVQVRAFADAFYKSDYFPSSRYCFGTEGAFMPYDPLKIICDAAKKYSIKIEAWINPYRVSFDENVDKLSDSNIAKKWYKKKKTKSNVYIFKKGIFFNPASKAVTKLIVNGAVEIAGNYDISAIHFDDYFYPSTDKNIDKKQYKKYIKSGGKLSLGDFRRNCVSDMIKSVYSAIKDVSKNIRFGISPAANIKDDYANLYADVEKWVSEKGYVDYICPQVYFGFRNVYQPFMFTVKKWSYITKCDLLVGLPLYKAGKADKHASKDDEEIINEFKNNNNIIARQINYLAKLDNIKGFYVFSYSCLNDKRCKQEVENILKAISNQAGSEPHSNHPPDYMNQ